MRLVSSNLLFSCLILIRRSTSQNAYSVALPSEVSSFLPACAQPCLKSSVEQRFPESKCSSNPTLECLCLTTTTSGDKLGTLSGACINFGIRDGLCTGNDAVPTARQNAFKVCSAVQSGTPVVTPSARQSTTLGTQTQFQSPSITPSPVSSASQAALPSAPTSSMSSTSLSTTEPSSPGSTSSVPSPISKSTPGLSTAERIGIGLGITLGSFIIVLLAAIIFLILRRRKRNNTSAEPLSAQTSYSYTPETLAMGDKILELDSTTTIAELGPDMAHEIEGTNIKRKSKRKSRTWSMWVRGMQDGNAHVVELDGTCISDRRG